MNKKIRILATIPNFEGLKSWGDVHRELFNTIQNPDVDITMADLPDAPIKSVSNAFDATMLGYLHAQLAIQAEKDGFDGVAFGCLDEPGLDAAREALSIPVVGDLEAAIHFASLVGRRFSFIIPGPIDGNLKGGYGAYLLEDSARKYNMLHKLASIRSVSGGSLDFAAEDKHLPQAMLEQACKAVEEDGADAVIGYGSLRVFNYLAQNLNVPVIDPVRSAVILVESLIRVGLTHSKRAFPIPANLKLFP